MDHIKDSSSCIRALLAATQPEGSLAARCLAAPERLLDHCMALTADMVATATGQRPGCSLLTRLAAALFCLTVVVSVLWDMGLCIILPPLPCHLLLGALVGTYSKWCFGVLLGLWQFLAMLLCLLFLCGHHIVAWMLPMMTMMVRLLLWLLRL